MNKGTAIPKNKGTAINKNTYHRLIDGKSVYDLSWIKVQPFLKIHIIDR